MAHLTRYCVSHCLRAAMTRLEHADGEVSVRPSVRWLDYLSRVQLLVALCLGLYARWWTTADSALLVLRVLALIIPAVATVSTCLSGAERVGLGLLHLWFGFVLGLQGVRHSAPPEADPKARAANYLLLASVVSRSAWALLERLLGRARSRPVCLTAAERLELAGFAVASTALPARDSVSVMVLLAALAAGMVALRMKACMALPNSICFAAVAGALFFEALRVPTNPFALGCFFGRLICDPLLDVCFSGLSVTERWQPFLVAPWRRLALLPLTVVEVTFIVESGKALADLDRWYLMIPAFAVFASVWAASHTVFVITLWGFHTKLSECQARLFGSQGSGVSGLNKVMASQGMRHFCIISKRLLMFSLLSTAAVAALCWQASSSVFLSVFLLVLPLEVLFHGLFDELGDSLGGTCVGYAVVIPTNLCSLDGQPMLLPPGQVQELNERSTGMLNKIQRFFAHHVIETFGCDYSTSGVTQEALQAKLTAFFDLQTADGPRHDTYVVFYSGHTHRTGAWALAGGDSLRLDQILQWWRERNGSFCSRLILVLDCDNSSPWVNEVRKVEGLYVAVQGATLARGPDVEQRDPPQLGDFTSQWVEYNCNANSNVRWSERGRAVLADYGVSKYWSDYKLHLPTGSDVANYWSACFPGAAYPAALLVAGGWMSGKPNESGPWGYVTRYLRRLKLNWYPPATLDTGQGFKLVRSYKT